MEHLVGVKQNAKTVIAIMCIIDYVFNRLNVKLGIKAKKNSKEFIIMQTFHYSFIVSWHVYM